MIPNQPVDTSFRIRTVDYVAVAALFVHAFLNERLVIRIGTDGRGLFPITAAIVPLLAVLVLRSRSAVIPLLVRRPLFWASTGCLAAWACLAPVAAIPIYQYPARTLLAATEGLTALSAVCIGSIVGLSRGWNARYLGRLIAAVAVAELLISGAQAASAAGYDFVATPWLTTFDSSTRELYGEAIVYGRSVGTFVNPNTLGLAAALTLFFGNAFAQGHLRMAVLFASMPTLILSQSRGAAFALIGGLLVPSVLKLPSRQRSGLTLVLAGAALLVAIVIDSASVEAALQTGAQNYGWAERLFTGLQAVSFDAGADANLAARMLAWSDALAFASQYPAGTLGPPHMLFQQSIDSEFLRLWCQGGLIALLLAALSATAAFYRGTRSREIRFVRQTVATLMIAGASAVVLPLGPTVVLWFGWGLVLASEIRSGSERRGAEIAHSY
jgi:hypothetical protein